MSPEIWIGLGSNLGDRLGNLNFALKKLSDAVELRLISSVYETQAWGNPDQPQYLNAVCSLVSECEDPVDFLAILKEIEITAGRRSSHGHWNPRPLDLDILFWGSRIMETEQLTVPHPLIMQRRFVLEPLCEIAPNLRNPITGQTVREILGSCPDRGDVRISGKLDVRGQLLQSIDGKYNGK